MWIHPSGDARLPEKKENASGQEGSSECWITWLAR